MVQRRDSLSYVEFLRGKYKLNNREYLMRLFTNMTPEERDRISDSTFEQLWSGMWSRKYEGESVATAAPTCGREEPRNHTKAFNREWREAAEKFTTLKKGYYIITADGDKVFMDIQWILENTVSEQPETEWGFPKGRRNINEDDMKCALREFREETGLSPSLIRVTRDIKPIEEVFTGSNNVRYKHVYYIAKYSPTYYRGHVSTLERPLYDPENTMQTKEVRDVRWFTYQEAQQRIRGSNVERKELFKRLNQLLIKSFCHTKLL